MGEVADEFLMQEGVLYVKPKYGSVFVFKEPEGETISDRITVSYTGCLRN